MRLALLPSLILVICGPAAMAEPSTELSFYGSTRSARDGGVSGNDPGGAGGFSLTTRWNVPASQGMRLTWWRNERFGWGVDFSNGTFAANDSDLTLAGIGALSFEDGMSLLTINAYRRSETMVAGFQPYVGAGMGVSLPKVQFDGGGAVTSSRQFTGPAVQIIAGARYPLSGGVSLFGEYQGSYSVNMADLVSGGTVETDILSGGINVGISLGF